MGVIRFQVHPPRRVTPEMAQRAYFTAPDRSLWRSRARLTDDGLVLERVQSDSGYFHIPWPVEGHGEVALSTAWLMERDRPYHLEIELARGKLNQVRGQLFDWQQIGLEVPEGLQSLLHEAVAELAAASTERDEGQTTTRADRAIRSAVEAACWLSRCFAEQCLIARRHQHGRLETHLGAHLGDSPLPANLAPLVKGSFNALCVPLSWRSVEADEQNFDWRVGDQQVAWCRERGLAVHAGPLLSFDDLGMPDWLCAWGLEDADSLIDCASEFVEAAVTRYRGKVDVWRCAARVNAGDVLPLPQEDRLRLVLHAVQTTRSLDPDTPIVVGFDQPWGEYTRADGMDFPRYLADSVVRSEVGVTGLGLELNIGYHPGGSYLRDPLDVSQLIDYWSALGLPLHVSLTIPSGSTLDSQARNPSTPLASAFPGGWSTAVQQQLTEAYLPVLLSKPSVRSVVWNQLRDAQPHPYPHGGLFDAKERPKAALGVIAALREKYLK